MGRNLLVACLMLLALGGGEAHAGRKSAAEVRVARPTDAAVAGVVRHELLRQPGIRGGDLRATAQDGVVILEGRVEDLLSAERAVRVARAAFGVRAVIDLIEVDLPERGDLVLSSAIRTAWAFDPVTESHQLGVQVQEGIARLRGAVESHEERAVAERLARGIPGVHEVRNGIVVRELAHRGDGEIREEIEGRLRWDVGVPAERIAVQVHDGCVTLDGMVGSEDQRRRAAELAQTRGARQVANRLGVDPAFGAGTMRPVEPRILDDELLGAVRAAIRLHPRLRAEAVDVSVRDGVVRLSGTVEDETAHAAAIGAALGAVGCRKVENGLSLREAVAVDGAAAPGG